MARRRWVFILVVILAALWWANRERLGALVSGLPRTADDHLNAGIKAYQLGEYGEAIKAFEQAVKAEPSRGDSRYFLAQAFEALGRTDEAVRQYNASVQRDRNLAVAHYNLAVIYRTRGDYTAAEAALKEAIGASPAFSGAHLLLGTLYFSRSDWENALTELTAAATNPYAVRADETGLRLMLAATYAKLGRVDQAAAEYRKVISLDPANREAEEQLHALNRL